MTVEVLSICLKIAPVEVVLTKNNTEELVSYHHNCSADPGHF